MVIIKRIFEPKMNGDRQYKTRIDKELKYRWKKI